MSYSYKQSVEMFGKEKADELFHKAGVATEKPKKQEKELTEKEYIKLSEYEHGKRFVKHIRENYPEVKFTHIGLEAGQSGTKNIIIMQAKKKASGCSKGFPDYIIFIPAKGFTIPFYMELKKAKGVKGGWNGSSFSEEQADWLNSLQDNLGSFTGICHGYKEAIGRFEELINVFKDKTPVEVVSIWQQRTLIDYKQYIC